VRRLGECGAVVMAVARRREPLEALASETGARALTADAANADDVDALARRIGEEGAVFALINAAGSFDMAPVAETEPEMFERMVSGNLRAPFLMTRAFLPAMLEAGAGHVVTIGSVAGRVAFPGNGAYSASKFGVRGLHEVLVQELRGTGVRATLVEPAATDTGIWDPFDPDRRDDLPGRDAMLPAEAVADAVLYTITRPPEVHLPAVAVQRS
jgi:NADP-dependent 3-hydroxy acid dehydrogenase YdfG